MNTLELGNKVVDDLTGFTGIVTGICQYLNSSTRVQVTSQELKDGKTIEEWFDVLRLKAV